MYISLKTKIWLFVNLSILSITVFTYFYFPSKQYHYLVEASSNEVQYMANTLGTGITIALSDGNFQGIKTSMEYAQADSRLKFIAMVQIDTVLTQTGSPKLQKSIFRIYPEQTSIDVNAQSGTEMIIKRANFSSDIMNGEIIIAFSTNEIVSNVENLRKSILVAAVFIVLVSSILSYFISSTITRPLHQLREATHQIGAGNLNFKVSLKRNDELGDLVSAFDKMVNELDKSRKSIKQKNTELKAANDELTNLNAEKNNLIHIVSHDLRSPLNQVMGLLSLIKLQNESLSENDLKVLEQAENSIQRMYGMIVKILDIEAIETKKLNVALENISLREILSQLTEQYSLPASKKDITLHTEGALDDYFVSADKQYLALVFDNLLSNAIKFSPPKSNVYITIAPDTDNGYVEVGIQDEGPGISKSDQLKLFNKYQRLSARPTAGESSIGLGLSIVKKYVEMMNGQVFYEDVSNGSKFVVKLRR